MVGEDGECVDGVFTRLGRLGDGRRSLTLLGNLDRVRADVLLADNGSGATGHPQAYPVAGLRAIRSRTTRLADADAVALPRLSDGCRVVATTVLGDADVVLGIGSGG